MTYIFDLHSDILIDVARLYQKIHKNKKAVRTLAEWQEIMSQGNIKGRVLSVWIEEVYKPGNTLKRAIDLIEIAKRELKLLENAVLIKSHRDLDNFSRDDKFYYLLSLEGADPIYDDIFLLDELLDIIAVKNEKTEFMNYKGITLICCGKDKGVMVNLKTREVSKIDFEK